MKKYLIILITFIVIIPINLNAGWPTAFPVGLTIYNPEKVYPGYTLISPPRNNPMLIDMEGFFVRYWKVPIRESGKLLPNGHIQAMTADSFVEYDQDGNIIRTFKFPEGITAHHDAHIYENGNILVACHRTIYRPEIASINLQDDCLLEFTPDGKLIWEWQMADHYFELDLTYEVRDRIKNYEKVQREKPYDWAHLNSVDPLPPNKRSDDLRFKPGNLIMSFRHISKVLIIDRETGKVVWQIGPDFSRYRELRPIINQHDAKMIPQDCPGAGNILIFDNGGDGYYVDNHRDHSRVVELDPDTLKPVWIYEAKGRDPRKFFSQHISGAQRLPNGNTFICEGAMSRLFEVTPEKEIVWEYMVPFEYDEKNPGTRFWTYRASRYPIDYLKVKLTPGEREQKANKLLREARKHWLNAKEKYNSVSDLYSKGE